MRALGMWKLIAGKVPGFWELRVPAGRGKQQRDKVKSAVDTIQQGDVPASKEVIFPLVGREGLVRTLGGDALMLQTQDCG